MGASQLGAGSSLIGGGAIGRVIGIIAASIGALESLAIIVFMGKIVAPGLEQTSAPCGSPDRAAS